ncbi:MAG: hypothetical protein ACT6FE_03735 [Methanosarcinaceae archaeon]
MRIVSQVIFTGLVLFSLFGCMPSSPSEEISENITLSIINPTLEPVEGYPWEQTKENVTITIAPEPVDATCVYQRSIKKKSKLFKINDDGTDEYDVKDKPIRLDLNPDRLILKLNVTNNISHVLRFHGAVPTLTVDGKNLPIDEKTKNELLRAVLTPHTTLDLKIDCIKLSALENASTVIFAIYDVITAVDAANNPTKRTTFEWIFSVRSVNVEKSFAVRTSKNRYTPAQATKVGGSFVR